MPTPRTPGPTITAPILQRVNYVEFCCGRKGEGKSFLLARRAAKFPRRIVLDFADEFGGVYPGAIECLTYAQCLDALETLAPSSRWIIVASLSVDDVAKLCALLSPEGRPRAGVAAALGGVLVECGEVERIAPNGPAFKPAIAELIHRGRHSRVSMVWGTRRPRDVNRLVTSQADVITAFRQQEPRDVEYLTSVIGPSAATLAHLNKYEHLQYVTSDSTVALVDKDGNAKEIF